MGRWLLLAAVAALPFAVYAVRAFGESEDEASRNGAATQRTDPEAANLYRLYLLQLDGGAPRAVPDPRENPYLTFDPAWSPGGEELAVTEIDCHNCTPEVRIVELERPSAPRRKLAAGSQPTFAPDGRTVAFVPAEGGLATIGVDGSRRRTLFEDDGGSISRPRFAPDGEWIAFMRQDRRGRWHVWIARPDGSGARQLTSGARPEADPAWTADGDQIAFARQAANGLWHLHVVTRSGRESKPLTGARTSDSHPSFGPDGRSVVFVRQEGSRFSLVRQTLRDGEAEQLQTAPLREPAEPAVAPDGKTIAFVARQRG